MTIQAKLTEAVAAVCPIHGVSFTNINDKTTWKPSFKDEATPQQCTNAQIVIDAFVYVADDPADLDKLEKALKVAVLLTRKYANELKAGTYTNKTIADTKADVKAIWDALP